MSGQIVPGSRNGLTTQGYPGLGPILNSDSNLLNRNSQGSLNQQSQINLNVSSYQTQILTLSNPTVGAIPKWSHEKIYSGNTASNVFLKSADSKANRSKPDKGLFTD